MTKRIITISESLEVADVLSEKKSQRNLELNIMTRK